MAHRNRPALIVAVLASAVAAAASSAATSTAPVVVVRAHVSYTKTGFEYRAIHLTIRRNQRTRTYSGLGAAYFTRPRLSVRDLDADGDVEIWVDTYSGGAHCCTTSHFYRYAPGRRRYLRSDHAWGNVGYRAKNVDGRDGVELLSYDDRFAYRFTPFAASFFPLRLWHFDGGRLRNVTRLFPGLVEHDATELWNAYRRLRRTNDDVRGVLAAWLADQYVLGRGEDGWAAVETALARGELEGDGIVGPSGRAYVRELRAFLRRAGYAE